MSNLILTTGTSTGFSKLMTTTLAAGHTILASMRGATDKKAFVAHELSARLRVEVVSELSGISNRATGACYTAQGQGCLV